MTLCISFSYSAGTLEGMASFKYLGRPTLGNVLLTDVWYITYTDGTNMTVSLTLDSCLPVLQNIVMKTPQRNALFSLRVLKK